MESTAEKTRYITILRHLFSIVMHNFISDISHYDIVLNLATQAKNSLWIGTADIKDLYVIQGQTEKPFLGILASILKLQNIHNSLCFNHPSNHPTYPETFGRSFS